MIYELSLCLCHGQEGELLNFLQGLSAQTPFYMRGPHCEVLMIGKRFHDKSAPIRLQALRFNPQTPLEDRNVAWKNFEDLKDQSAEIVYLKNNHKMWRLVHPQADQRLVNQIERQRLECHQDQQKRPSQMHFEVQEECPDRNQWSDNILYILSLLQQEKVSKVVAARSKKLKAINPGPSWSKDIFCHEARQSRFAFLLQGQGAQDESLLCLTPERLFSFHQGQFEIDCLAATRLRGLDAQEDLELEEDLRQNQKENHEHNHVIAHVESILKRATLEEGKNLKWHLPFKHQVLKLKNVQHLYSLIKGEGDASVDELLNWLHPTSAVGGGPKDEALNIIAQTELSCGFDRGLYAGALGVIWQIDGQTSSDFLVAIRAALASANTLTLFAGCGIVPGSRPELEWQETENKMRAFTLSSQNKAYDERSLS